MDRELSKKVELLTLTYADIFEKKMKEMPIINKALHVDAFGFEQWNEFGVGALLTPWFLNLVLLPINKTNDEVTIGDKAQFKFYAGELTFIANFTPALGCFWTCSLLSPVFEIKDQQHGQEIAKESINYLLLGTDQIDDQTTTNEMVPERRKIMLKLIGKS